MELGMSWRLRLKILWVKPWAFLTNRDTIWFKNHVSRKITIKVVRLKHHWDPFASSPTLTEKYVWVKYHRMTRQRVTLRNDGSTYYGDKWMYTNESLQAAHVLTWGGK